MNAISLGSCTISTDPNTSRKISRVRYCLRSHHGYIAPDDTITQNPANAIQLVDLKSAINRVVLLGQSDVLPCEIIFQFDGKSWTPSPA